jgi:hypothetical protein
MIYLAPIFRDFSPSWKEGHGRAAHLTADRKQKKRKELGTRYKLERLNPSYLLPPARPHLLKFPLPPRTVPPDGDQVFNT